jgi:hypothetical protein
MKFELQDPQTTFGYLSAVRSPEYGCFGGYLVISSLGRPLEFHCTAPVQPTRAQEVLYGPTLELCLFGEQIRGSLLDAARIQPAVILTDQPAAIGEVPLAKPPLVLARSIDAMTNEHAATITMSPDLASTSHSISEHRLLCFWSAPFAALNCELRLQSNQDGGRERIVHLLTHLAERVELLEPFGRIHDAIREAQRIGQRGSESHAQAA